MPGPDESAQPKVAFGVIPDLGVAAALSEDHSWAAEVLRQYGFAHDSRRDIYLLPPGTAHHTAVHAVAATARKLQRAGLSVAADPRVVATGPPPKPSAPVTPPRQSLADLSAALSSLERPSDVAHWLRSPVDGQGGVIPQLRHFLGSAAAWCDRLDHTDGPELARHLRSLAEHVEVLGDRLAHVSHYLDGLPPVTQGDGQVLARRAGAATASSPHRPAAAAKTPPEATQPPPPVPRTRRTR
ncbi:hypothetical protein [Streptomyces sclerotialus]|uniref:hypothetical protein n=1 Tax=Streptomyces sclerotialus TaxID=1957 RepID=UPI000690A222